METVPNTSQAALSIPLLTLMVGPQNHLLTPQMTYTVSLGLSVLEVTHV